MESRKVKELRDIAKQRGVRGYYAMRKADLIAALAEVEVKPQVNLTGFDACADEQMAKPQLVMPQATTWSEWLTDHVSKPVTQAVSSAYDWIMDKVPQSVIKVVDTGFYKLKNKITKLFKKTEQERIPIEFTLAASALKNVTKQYSVFGIAGYDAETFLGLVKADQNIGS